MERKILHIQSLVTYHFSRVPFLQHPSHVDSPPLLCSAPLVAPAADPHMRHSSCVSTHSWIDWPRSGGAFFHPAARPAPRRALHPHHVCKTAATHSDAPMPPSSPPPHFDVQLLLLIVAAALARALTPSAATVGQRVLAGLVGICIAYVFADPVAGILTTISGYDFRGDARLIIAGVLAITGDQVVRHITRAVEDPSTATGLLQPFVAVVRSLVNKDSKGGGSQ